MDFKFCPYPYPYPYPFVNALSEFKVESFKAIKEKMVMNIVCGGFRNKKTESSKEPSVDG